MQIGTAPNRFFVTKNATSRRGLPYTWAVSSARGTCSEAVLPDFSFELPQLPGDQTRKTTARIPRRTLSLKTLK